LRANNGFAQDDKGKLLIVTQERLMQDILWIAATIAFFALSIAYVQFCERVK
jgi:hypothetical protein